MAKDPAARRFVVALALGGLVAGACGSDSGPDVALRSGTDAPVLEQLLLAGIAAHPDGGGWLLEDTDEGVAVNRFEPPGGLERVGVLPVWDAIESSSLADGRLAVAGVRCEPVEECSATMSELVFVSADGAISDPVPMSTREGGAPNESDVVRIIGEADGLLWMQDFTGQLVAVDGEGNVRHELSPDGDACAVADTLYSLATDVESKPGDEPIEFSPTSDPDNPTSYRVLVIEDGQLTELEGGSVDAPSNAIGQCVDGGFEIYVSGDTSSQRWSADSGWAVVERALDPKQPRSTHAAGSRGDEFIVDADGALAERAADGSWLTLPITFQSSRSADGPPLVLFADRVGDVVIACLSVEQEDPAKFALECHAKATR